MWRVPRSRTTAAADRSLVSSRRLQRVPVPVFVNEIFRRHFADGTEPLRAPGAHPDKVTSGDGIPSITEAVDASAFEHEQAVFHDVHFDLTESGTRLVQHRVDGEIVAEFIGQKTFDVEI